MAVFQNRSSNLAGHAQPSLILTSSSALPSEPFLFRVGAAAAEMEADDSMVIGGSIEPVKLAGQEGKLRATAVVIAANTRLCLVACDVLIMNRDLLDQAARRIEKDCAIPFDHILINASHTHHAPSTVTIHGYEGDEVFSRRAVEAIVTAARQANDHANSAEPSQLLFRLGQEATVGQNSRQLLKDGEDLLDRPARRFCPPDRAL